MNTTAIRTTSCSVSEGEVLIVENCKPVLAEKVRYYDDKKLKRKLLLLLPPPPPVPWVELVLHRNLVQPRRMTADAVEAGPRLSGVADELSRLDEQPDPLARRISDFCHASKICRPGANRIQSGGEPAVDGRDVGADAMDKSASREPEQLVLLDSSTALPLEGLETPLADSGKRANRAKRANGANGANGAKRKACYKLQLNMGLLEPRLREHARRLGTSMAVLVRRATLKMLDDEDVPAVAGGQPFEHSVGNLHFHLNLPAACHAELTARARAADMTRGEFVWSLLKGISPPALPPDHAAAVLALRVSTDRLAAMATDLSEFLRLVTRAAATKEEAAPYQASLKSLNQSVADHLKTASVLIAELKPYRRARW